MKTLLSIIAVVSFMYSCKDECKMCTDVVSTEKWVRPAGSSIFGLDKTTRDTTIFEACGDEIESFENQPDETTDKMIGGAGYRTVIKHQCDCN